MSRRDSNDQEWQAIKQAVRTRDSDQCRLLRIVSLRDALLLKRKAGALLNVLDPCHILPVSTNPSLIYEESNIVTVNRYSHDKLDNFRHPISGEPISKDTVLAWWERIAGEQQWATLMSKNGGVSFG